MTHPCRWHKWRQKCVDDSETHNWLSANSKPCPKCAKLVEKNGGCNLVYCMCGQVCCLLRLLQLRNAFALPHACQTLLHLPLCLGCSMHDRAQAHDMQLEHAWRRGSPAAASCIQHFYPAELHAARFEHGTASLPGTSQSHRMSHHKCPHPIMGFAMLGADTCSAAWSTLCWLSQIQKSQSKLIITQECVISGAYACRLFAGCVVSPLAELTLGSALMGTPAAGSRRMQTPRSALLLGETAQHLLSNFHCSSSTLHMSWTLLQGGCVQHCNALHLL